MIVKTVQCALCGEHVNKRRTLSLTELGGKAGRACRSHEEVIGLERQQARDQEQVVAERRSKMEQEERDERFVSIEYGVSMVRALQSLGPVNPEAPYLGLARTGYTIEAVEEVRRLVQLRVDQPLSVVEKNLAMEIFMALKQEKSA